MCGSLLAAAALVLPAAQRASAQPSDPSAGSAAGTTDSAADPSAGSAVPLADLLTRLQSAYQQTETATEAYNKAKADADRLRAAARSADAKLARQKVAVDGSRTRLGLMASQMYRDGAVSPYLSLLTGQTPQDFFGQRHVLGQLAGQQQAEVKRLTAGESRLRKLNTSAQRALDKAEHAQSVAAAKKKDVQSRLSEVEGMLAGLTGVQIDQLQALEQSDDDKAQTRLMDAKALGDDPALRAPSLAGDRAIGYAFDQLGRPYQWGAQGPDAFDCSGLTSQAWAHAGVPIPRTSQEQWAKLPHVPLQLLRPGDLVVYFKGATHVALYIGDGLVIQAPRPGSYVKVSPIAANPILGAVRPDSGSSPLRDYTPRPIPKDAEAPTPIGAQASSEGSPQGNAGDPDRAAEGPGDGS
jgi:cell wall-associated NlpC family hydrolase